MDAVRFIILIFDSQDHLNMNLLLIDIPLLHANEL